MAACGPIQGYPGPERPDNETALVEPKGDGDIVVQVGEYEFQYRGIRLLPGPYRFSVAYAHRDEPYDCRILEDFNEYGYWACRRERDRQIRKGSEYVRSCYQEDYWDRYEECKVPYYDSSCSVSATVKAGKSYNMTFGIRGKSGAPEFRDAIEHRILEVGKCDRPSPRTEVERRSL